MVKLVYYKARHANVLIGRITFACKSLLNARYVYLSEKKEIRKITYGNHIRLLTTPVPIHLKSWRTFPKQYCTDGTAFIIKAVLLWKQNLLDQSSIAQTADQSSIALTAELSWSKQYSTDALPSWSKQYCSDGTAFLIKVVLHWRQSLLDQSSIVLTAEPSWSEKYSTDGSAFLIKAVQHWQHCLLDQSNIELTAETSCSMQYCTDGTTFFSRKPWPYHGRRHDVTCR